MWERRGSFSRLTTRGCQLQVGNMRFLLSSLLASAGIFSWCFLTRQTSDTVIGRDLNPNLLLFMRTPQFHQETNTISSWNPRDNMRKYLCYLLGFGKYLIEIMACSPRPELLLVIFLYFAICPVLTLTIPFWKENTVQVSQ